MGMGKARLDNRGGHFKTEEQHIAHVKERIKERFDLNISTEEYHELLELVKLKSKQLYRLNTQNSVKAIEFKGKEMLVVFGCSSAKRGLPARIKTVLYVDSEYPVPDALIRQDIQRVDFTKQIKDIINEMIAFSKDVMPGITVKELFTNPKYSDLPFGFRAIVKRLAIGAERVNQNVLIAVAAKIIIQKYDKDMVEEDPE